MKRVISVFVILCMVFSVVLPANVFAQDGKELEQIIKSVKEKIDVPEKLTEFNYSAYTQGDIQIWNLSWNGKDTNDGSVNISVLADGTIQSYNYYEGYINPQDGSKLPKLSKAEAQKIAENFIKKINPKMFPQLKLNENNNQSLMNSTYSFNYLRYINNIPFRANNVSIDVNLQEGYVQNYYRNWSDNLQFPDPSKVISLEEAQKNYKEKLGLTLVYNYKVDNEKVVTYLAYQPKYNDYYIDALSGEKIKLQNDIYYSGMGDVMNSESMSAADKYSLTPQEQSAVDEASNILTREEVEKTVRDNKTFDLNDHLKLTNIGLYKNWFPPKDFIWSLDFTSGDQKDYKYINVRMNAKTGEIISFSIGSPSSDTTPATYNSEQAKAVVQKFLNEFYPDKFKDTVFDDNFEKNIYPLLSSNQNEMPRSYSFRYLRKVNGIPFIGNYINIGFDAVSGKITNFDMQWFDAKFGSPNKVISSDKAYDKLFTSVGYGLQYRTEYNDEVYMKYKIENSNKDIKPNVKIVYALNPQKPSIIDAFKGDILNNDGTLFKDNKSAEYIDIDNSFAKNEINFLAQYGIAFDGKKFRPTYKMTQKEFLYLLAKSQNTYEQYVLKKPKDTERLYSNLIRNGIVKETEKSPNQLITKEDAAKFIVRAMKYDKIADLKNIFACDFLDKEDINPDLVGYTVLAKGLGVMKDEDGKFNPKSNITREQGAVVIYNLLKK